VQILEVPAHTRGAITFVMDGAAFTGDTLFAMGCGRLFEGTPAMMWSSLSKLAKLPDARGFIAATNTPSPTAASP